MQGIKDNPPVIRLFEGAGRMGLQRCSEEETGRGQQEAKEGRIGETSQNSAAVQARGREGSGRILGDGGSHGRGSGVHRLGRPKWSLGHEWFIRGQKSNGKWSRRPGSRCHGGENRNHQMEVRAEEVDRR